MEASERRVAVVGDDGRPSELRDAVRDAGGHLTGPASTSAERRTIGDDDTDSDLLVAVGDEAIRDAVVAATDCTVIPVTDRRLAFDRDGAVDVLRRLLDKSAGDDSVRRVSHPVLAVDSGTDPHSRAAFDVAVVTDEPARISEFAVEFPRGQTESVRADGVVVATPLGSDGYANAAGGALVEPDGGLSIAPIAPFSTRTDAWVAADRIRLTVEREGEPIALVTDGERRVTVEPHRPIEIETVDRVAFAAPRGSRERADRKHSNNS
ncbi:NAD(+)/NADH kinase [Halorubrum lacusprofundi]|jgi:NAD+ kinase|uniref:ATP-NAD/AcoX kinase n=1 Tax=Halorubrum lacusprofundi (strain ATCC 49239 / DSM 5036 / JCM 8891 / ACAM 34) TaxID=416348 RepID=B9LU97_HALLT|nr:NAD(+)/NADH kinase [Halorubrum lacusprofundi]ACM56254.1 ATP-NAD/AcoX kinase [Halorubrum lacusprofundi ATCC 49239]MCG1005438.1 NAD(+)/NADH kinase [Halorubrum lacusprofundi]